LARQVAEAQATVTEQQISARETLTEERTRLRAEIEQLRNTADDMANRSSTDQNQLNSLLAEVTSARSRITNLEDQLTSAGEQNSEMTAVTSRMQLAEEELRRQRVANSQLQSSITGERRTHESRLDNLERENTALNSRLRQAQSTLDQIAAATRVLNPGTSRLPDTTQRSRPPATSSRSPSTAGTTTNAGRTHVVTEGDSLTRISMLYYGTPTGWQDIYRANREVLSEANALRPGQQLQIP